jgi:hypothetical protein
MDETTQVEIINCDFPWSALVKIIHDAKTSEDRELLLEFLVIDLDFVVRLRSPIKRHRYHKDRFQFISAVNAVRYCLRDSICQEYVWKWLFDALSVMNSEMQIALAVGVLCPILAGPIPWHDDREMFAVNKVMECYMDINTRWVVIDGFGECSPSQVRDTIERYNRWRESHGHGIIDVDIEELEQHLIT